MTTLGLSVSAAGVSYARSGRQILSDVSLEAAPGELTLVTGPSGSGKSTLMALLAGLEVPDVGEVRHDGVPLDPQDLAARRRLGLVLQGYGLVSLLTAAENLHVVLQSRGLTTDEARHSTDEALDLVGLLEWRDHLVDELSGGQQQRVAIARALCTRPAVVLADEPTAELDAATRSLVVEQLGVAAGRGAAVVVATHDLGFVEWADAQVELDSGVVVRAGAPQP